MPLRAGRCAFSSFLPHNPRLLTLILFLTSLTLLSSNTFFSSTMASKLVPPNPDDVMVIRKVTPNITTLSVPFKRFGRINIGGRGTLGM